jgi:hexosaminidase
MNIHLKNCLPLLLLSFFFVSSLSAQNKQPARLKLGYSIAVGSITAEKMRYAHEVGISYIEVTLGELTDTLRNIKLSDAETVAKVKQAKQWATDNGIQIWSVHMPYGKNIDLSLSDENERQQVVALQKKVLAYCKILQPKIILFHPSWYLSLNERELHKTQLIKSATELNAVVKSLGATMVIENMLGPELMANAKYERPLCRTVEETVEIMNRLPKDIYSAIDMNHIREPEKLIAAMGSRLKSVHISDGTGLKEDHFFPCSGQGKNNWVKILAALNDAGYTGPFMYECGGVKDLKDLPTCYNGMYNDYLTSLGIKAQ